jgi:hypothetical protein
LKKISTFFRTGGGNHRKARKARQTLEYHGFSPGKARGGPHGARFNAKKHARKKFPGKA